MRVGYAVRSRHSSVYVSGSLLSWMVVMPVMAMVWLFQASIVVTVWMVRAMIWFYTIPLKLAWREYQAAQKRRRTAQRMAH